MREQLALADELQRVLDETPLPALSDDEQGAIRSIVVHARVSDQGRVNVAGRDRHIHEK
ncbi:hypothetical protein [Embleya sp. NPDC020630]|uniref:hypothetical protein n=1 Tax=Embleya sp. NPDC020630 TaxID=3363979 RepID=UPI003795D7B8